MLFQEALRWVESEKSRLSSIPHPGIPLAHLGETLEPASKLHPAFGTLMNMVLDAPIRANTIHFIRSGLLHMSIRHRRTASMIAADPRQLQVLQESHRSMPDSDVSRMIFLDMMIVLLSREKEQRQRSISSPMPWSRVSALLLRQTYSDVYLPGN